jgi:hypothetical protein
MADDWTDPSSERERRFEVVAAEWRRIAADRLPNEMRFIRVKREADAIIDAGQWVSGPADLLSVLGRQRDELVHSRMIGWLLTPTGRHGLGRRFLQALLDHVWPGQELLATGLVTVDVETTRSAADDVGLLREARADIVVIGEDATIVIENKVDAEEGTDQCERLYWAWADQPTEIRWLFLSPTGRSPVTASSAASRAAWRTIGYGDLQRLLRSTLAGASESDAGGRSTAAQYLAAIAAVVPR